MPMPCWQASVETTGLDTLIQGAIICPRYADKRGRRREEGANAILLYRLYAAKLGQHVFAFLLEQVSPVDKHGHKLFDEFGICLDDLPCSLVALVCYFVELGVYFVQLFLRIGKIFVAASAVSQIQPLQPVRGHSAKHVSRRL